MAERKLSLNTNQHCFLLTITLCLFGQMKLSLVCLTWRPAEYGLCNPIRADDAEVDSL